MLKGRLRLDRRRHLNKALPCLVAFAIYDLFDEVDFHEIFRPSVKSNGSAVTIADVGPHITKSME
jgi:hypothetical protein